MSLADIFKQDAFGMVSLTRSVNKLPYVPRRLGAMNLFESQPINTTTAVIEEQEGTLSLIPSTERGAQPAVTKDDKRKAHALIVPHMPQEKQIRADSIQGVREFGSTDAMKSVAKAVNDKLAQMRRHHEATEEWLRIGAIQGLVKDGDNTRTLADLFTIFGITETVIDFDLSNDAVKMAGKCADVTNAMEDALGGAEWDHIHAVCGRTFFKEFITHPDVQYAFQYYDESSFLRTDPRAGFEYSGITFEQYRGKLGAVPFVPDGECRLFPVGVPELFVTAYAPADFVETANTNGLPVYAKQELGKFGRSVDLHTQSNALPLCTRPACLIKGTNT